MGIGIEILRIAVFVFLILLMGRVAVNLISTLARDWRPHGFTLVVVEGILSATDPPVRFLRSRMPTIDLGGIRLDLSMMILVLLCMLVLNMLAYSLSLVESV